MSSHLLPDVDGTCDHVLVLSHGRVAAEGPIASLKGHGPYLVVLVELPEAGNVRMVGNLLGDPMQEVTIGAPVHGVFEHHTEASPPYSLLQWQRA